MKPIVVELIKLISVIFIDEQEKLLNEKLNRFSILVKKKSL